MFYIPAQHAPYEPISVVPVLIPDDAGDVFVSKVFTGGATKYRKVAECERFPSGLFRALVDGRELNRHGYKSCSSIFNWVKTQDEVRGIVEKYYHHLSSESEEDIRYA